MLDKLKKETVVSVYKPIDFPVVDNDSLANELDVVNLSKQAARQGLPSLGSIGPDANEINFKQKIETKAIQASNRIKESTSVLSNLILEVNIRKEFTSISEMNNEFKNKVSATFTPILKDIETLKEEVRSAEDDVRTFKKVNGIRRNAHYPPSSWGTIGVLLIALVLESVLNGVFFAAGQDLGLVGGVAEALVISCLNIGIGFIAGWWILTYKNHCLKSKEYLAYLFFTAVCIFSFCLNIGAAHYREALVSDPDNARTNAVEAFINGIVSIHDVDSWLLFSLGIFFFSLAVYKGYRSDDEYPGYGRISRKKDDLMDDLTNEREEALSLLDDMHQELLSELDETYEIVKRSAKQLSSYISSLEHQNSIYVSYIQHLENALLYITTLYRETNQAARGNDYPDYFNAEIDVSLKVNNELLGYVDNRDSLANEKDKLAEIIPSIRSGLLKLKEDYYHHINKATGL